MILNKIDNPDDLKKIGEHCLPELCSQIRNIIIDTVSKNGGHIAPSLGVVELSVALHYVFDSPNDKIIWDVGHQSYAHKILTGRRENFHTLRLKDGISGFPKPDESQHDIFGTGHASTSISAALGIAKAMNRNMEKNRAIAIIGDGSMTGGLALEALNHAGHKVGNLTVILNDNEMSISPNVGAVSRFLSLHMHGKTAGRVRRFARKLLMLTGWGKWIYGVTQKAEEAALSFFTPGAVFEAFGFNYIGPLDGHDIHELIRVFKDVKSEPLDNKPLLIHVMTKKGRGYKPAEKDPTTFHGIGPFDKNNGKKIGGKEMTYTEAFGKAVNKLAEENDKVMAITAAMATGTGLTEFAKKYPDRFFDVGIAEGHAVTFAAGLTTQGYRPIVAIYSTFLQRAYDNIIHDVSLQNLPVIFALDRAGVVGDDGPTHHGTFDLSYLRSIPNLKVLAPRSASQLEKMLNYAVKSDGPVAIRYPRGLVPEEVFYSPDKFVPGKAQIVWQSDLPRIAIWAVGHLVSEGVAAAEILKEKGVSVTVIDPCSIKPLDTEMLRRVCSNHKAMVTVEENVLAGGFGSLVSEWMTKEEISSVRLKSLGLPDSFVPHSSQKDLRAEYGIDAAGIVMTIMSLIQNFEDGLSLESYPFSGKDNFYN